MAVSDASRNRIRRRRLRHRIRRRQPSDLLGHLLSHPRHVRGRDEGGGELVQLREGGRTVLLAPETQLRAEARVGSWVGSPRLSQRRG